MTNQSLKTAFAVLFIVLTTGCANRTSLPSAAQVPEGYYPTAQAQSKLGPGDSLSVSFLASVFQTESPYLLSVGDVLRVDVFDHPELSRDRVVVLPDGYVSLPVVGRVEAADRTIDSIQSELRGLYIAGNIVSPEVVVSVEENTDPLLPLLNLVNRNGQHEPLNYIIGYSDTLDLPFIEPVTVQTDFSTLQSMIKQRYEELFGSRLQVVIQLQKSAPSVVYVIGEVERPGPINYSEPLNPLMAIAAAGGLKSTAQSDDVRLFRRREDNSLDNWSINLEGRLDHGEAIDDQIPIVPLDVLYVPRSGIAEANRIVEQYIRNMLPIQFVVGGQVVSD
ncbi:MAG: polysaccharide biosynthesis/export family protein [Gammaproteobacteria bacterium]|jgi:polysaccharide export outer membrane protein